MTIKMTAAPAAIPPIAALEMPPWSGTVLGSELGPLVEVLLPLPGCVVVAGAKVPVGV